MASSDKVYRWGIIGCGRISYDFCNCLTGFGRAEIVACAARNISSAKQFANKFDIKTYYGSYQELAQDKNIDIVYIGTIHPSHHQNTLLCLQNNKHVLSEKPMGINFRETKQMIDCALRNKLFLMEGIWTRFFPVTKQVKQWIDDGEIGNVIFMSADFGLSRSTPSQSATSWDKELNGGALLPLGCYVIDPLLRVFGERMPSKISSVGVIDEKYNVDRIVAVNILYEDSNQFAQINCNTLVKTAEECHIVGTKGRIKIPSMMHIPTKCELWKTVGREQKLVESKEFALMDRSSFKYQDFIFPKSEALIYEIEEVTKCLDNGLYECKGYKWNEMLLNSKISDTIRKQIGLKFDQDNQQSKL